MKPRSFKNVVDEDELDDSEDEEELPDFVPHEVSGMALDDDHVVEIQEVIDSIDLGLSDTDEAEDTIGPIISLSDLETKSVILKGSKPTTGSYSVNIFEKLGDLSHGMETSPVTLFSGFTNNFTDALKQEDIMVPTTTSFTTPTTPLRFTRSVAASENPHITPSGRSTLANQAEERHQIKTSRLNHLDLLSSPRKRPTQKPKFQNFLIDPLNLIPSQASDARLKPQRQTRSPSTLVHPTTLKQFGMAYNAKYDCVICVKCAIAIPFNGFVSHAYKGTVSLWNWKPFAEEYVKAPTYKHDYPHILMTTKNQRLPGTKGRKMPSKEIEGKVISELTEILGRKPNPVERHSTSGDDRRKSWITHLTPHPDQVGPIDGLVVYEHGLKCVTGSCVDEKEPFLSPQIRSMRDHLSVIHSSINPANRHFEQGIRMQSFSRVPGLALFFEVPMPPKDAELSSTKYPSLQEALKNERQELLVVAKSRDTINSDLIHPAFGDIGFVPFWEKLDLDIVKPILAIVPIGCKRVSGETKLLQNAVITTFLEICAHVKNASPGLRQLITKGAA